MGKNLKNELSKRHESISAMKKGKRDKIKELERTEKCSSKNFKRTGETDDGFTCTDRGSLQKGRNGLRKGGGLDNIIFECVRRTGSRSLSILIRQQSRLPRIQNNGVVTVRYFREHQETCGWFNRLSDSAGSANVQIKIRKDGRGEDDWGGGNNSWVVLSYSTKKRG